MSRDSVRSKSTAKCACLHCAGRDVCRLQKAAGSAESGRQGLPYRGLAPGAMLRGHANQHDPWWASQNCRTLPSSEHSTSSRRMSSVSECQLYTEQSDGIDNAGELCAAHAEDRRLGCGSQCKQSLPDCWMVEHRHRGAQDNLKVSSRGGGRGREAPGSRGGG